MPYLSIYRGIVTDRKDPEKRGRLKLKVPLLWGDDEHEYWALPKGLFSGNGIGLMAMPEVADSVWVQFEGGDIRYPVWEYGGWNKDKSLAAAYDDEGEPTKVTLITKSGQTLVLDDKGKVIELIHSDGSKLKLDADSLSLVHSKAISLGSEGSSAQPAVLGDKNADVLDTLRGQLNDLVTAMVADAASTGTSPFMGKATLVTILPQIVSTLATLVLKITQTKSQRVTLD